jgi:hypothetical protein
MVGPHPPTRLFASINLPVWRAAINGLWNQRRPYGLRTAASSGGNRGLLGNIGQPSESSGGLLSRFDEPNDTWEQGATSWRHLVTLLGGNGGIPASGQSSSPGPFASDPAASPIPMPPSQSAQSYGEMLALLAKAQLRFESGSDPVPVARKRINEAECLRQYNQDVFQCKMVGLAQCYAQAAERYGACLAGRPIPPFNY